MAKTFEVRNEVCEREGEPLCDGCGKPITAKFFLKWFFRRSGEDTWGEEEMEIELHSHVADQCVGRVIGKIFG